MKKEKGLDRLKLVPTFEGKRVNADLFYEYTPEKVELIDGKV